jgi:putative endopeptidase
LRKWRSGGNFLRANEFEARRQISKIAPVDRNEWQMTPPTVNAYASPPRNEIVSRGHSVIAGQQADDATNLGGIGLVSATNYARL